MCYQDTAVAISLSLAQPPTPDLLDRRTAHVTISVPLLSRTPLFFLLLLLLQCSVIYSFSCLSSFRTVSTFSPSYPSLFLESSVIHTVDKLHLFLLLLLLLLLKLLLPLLLLLLLLLYLQICVNVAVVNSSPRSQLSRLSPGVSSTCPRDIVSIIWHVLNKNTMQKHFMSNYTCCPIAPNIYSCIFL